MPPDASRQMPPGARCRQMPVARYQLPDVPPPGPVGGLGEVSRAPVLMSSALISGDVLPPSVLGPPDCDDERRAPAVKSGVPLLSMSPVQRFCSALSFHQRVLQTFTICGPSVVDLDGRKQTLPAMASGGGGGLFVPSAVRSRRRSPDPQISARGVLAVAAKLPQF